MKRFLALFLVLVLAFSCILVSCKKEEGEDPADDGDAGDGLIGINTGATTTLAPGSTTFPIGSTASDFIFEDVDETVYVRIDALNVRSDTNTKDETYRGTIYFGQSFKRVKYNAAWSVIDYNGTQYYVDSRYITTDNGSVIFNNDATETTVYVNVANTLNLRTSTYVSDGYTGNIGCTVKRGATLTRVATSANGNWIKVKFDGEFYYCNTSFVSNEVPGESTTPSSTTVVAG